MNKIKKVIIPAAGLGTRFLPATKSLPKEMFPIIDTPTLQYIVEEAHASGIEEVGIVVSVEKPCIKKYFEIDEALENHLIATNKLEEAKLIREIASLTKITFIIQDQPKGLGHAILCARDFINGEDFAIMLGDDLIVNRNGKPVLKQLIEAYEKTGCSVLGVQQVPYEDVKKYGVVDPKSIDGNLIKIKGMVEKPQVEDAPSNYAVLGRYVLTNKVFDYLAKIVTDGKKEIQLTTGIEDLLNTEDVYACCFEGIRYDIGDKFGYIKATIDFALNRDDLKDKVMEYIKKIAIFFCFLHIYSTKFIKFIL